MLQPAAGQCGPLGEPVITSQLADRYHADGVTPDERSTLVLLWQASQGMFDALLLVGLLVLSVGVVLLGIAMRPDPAFGRTVGSISVALGVAGLAGGTVRLIDTESAAAALGVIALIVFHFVAGWKLHRLVGQHSRAAIAPFTP